MTDLVVMHCGWLSGEGTKRLGWKKSANRNALDSAFRRASSQCSTRSHRSSLIPECFCISVLYCNLLVVSLEARQVPVAMLSGHILTRSCLAASSSRAPCRRLRALLSSCNHVRVQCRAQGTRQISRVVAIAHLQHGRGLTASPRPLVPYMHYQPRSLLSTQHRLYSVSSSSERGTDTM